MLAQRCLHAKGEAASPPSCCAAPLVPLTSPPRCGINAPRLCLHRSKICSALLAQLSPLKVSSSCVFYLVGHPLGRFDVAHVAFSSLLRCPQVVALGAPQLLCRSKPSPRRRERPLSRPLSYESAECPRVPRCRRLAAAESRAGVPLQSALPCAPVLRTTARLASGNADCGVACPGARDVATASRSVTLSAPPHCASHCCVLCHVGTHTSHRSHT